MLFTKTSPLFGIDLQVKEAQESEMFSFLERHLHYRCSHVLAQQVRTRFGLKVPNIAFSNLEKQLSSPQTSGRQDIWDRLGNNREL